ENCTTVGDLKKLGEVFEVLRQVLIPIQLMFVAGWVHRDISAGNILAYRQSEADTWTAKLSDLEYAKPFPPTDDVEAAKDPETGTPYFMPIEVHTSRCIFLPAEMKNSQLQGSQDTAQAGSESDEAAEKKQLALYKSQKEWQPAGDEYGKVHVIHNFQHDLETLWWLILYVLMALTNHPPSIAYSEKIFQNTTSPPPHRIDAFYHSIRKTLEEVLIESAQPLTGIMEDMRMRLVDQYVKRERKGRTNQPQSYDFIHQLFEIFLDKLYTDFPSCMDIDLVNPPPVLIQENPLAEPSATEESLLSAPASSAENPVPSTPPRTTVSPPSTPPPRASPESRPSRLLPPARVKAKRPASPNVVGQERVEGTRSKKHKH
ncbi:hypothetical protein CPC08DRAFT_731033, partial [Agrocybe pediades]